MKLARLAIALAVCGALGSSSVFADQVRQPGSVTATTTDPDYFTYFADEEEPEAAINSPSDIPVVDQPLIPVPVAADKNDLGGKDDDKGSKGCGRCERRFGVGTACMCGGEAWSLWSTIAPGMEECHNITAGGWMQLGYHTEGANGNGTGLFNNYPNVIQMQQAWLYLEKAIDADRCRAWDWGFRMDYVYGTDGPDTQAFGNSVNVWDIGWDNGNFYGHAIPQLNVQVAYNDLTVTMGHFFTILGYEVVPAPDNFFYSHAFTMYLAEPFTHTGLLAEYAVTDDVTAWGGWAAGWDTGFDRNEGDIFLGGVSLHAFEKVTFTYALTWGDFGFGAGGSDNDAYSHSFVVDVAVTERLNYVFQTDYVQNDDLRGVLLDGIDSAWGINQYLLYSINDCLGVGGRLEYFDDEAIGGDVWALTLGTNVKPHANVTLRPEVRWEEWDPASGRNNSFMFGMDAIFVF